MFGDILQKFVQKSPATVRVRGLLERQLNPEALDRWFEAAAQAQYTRDILFSSLVGPMLQIVCRTRPSVHAAYRRADIAASIVSVYAKLRGVELATSQGLVRHIAREAQTLIETIDGGRPAQMLTLRLKYRDGNCLAASEHRLKALRTTAAGALPGESLVVFDPQAGLAVDVFPGADGQAQARSLLDAVADTLAPGEVWVADRNFCVAGFLHAIDRRQAFFIVRPHGGLTTKHGPGDPDESARRHDRRGLLPRPLGHRNRLSDARTPPQLRDRNPELPAGRPVRVLPGAGGVQPLCRGHGRRCVPPIPPRRSTTLSRSMTWPARMGLPRLREPRAFFAMAPRPGETGGSAHTPQDPPWAEETTHPTNPVQR